MVLPRYSNLALIMARGKAMTVVASVVATPN